MITTEYITFLQSLYSSLLGLSIVFLSLIFLAIFVTLVSKFAERLEESLGGKAKAEAAKNTGVAEKKVNKNDGLKVAIITAAVSEEMKLPLDKFAIKSIKKI